MRQSIVAVINKRRSELMERAIYLVIEACNDTSKEVACEELNSQMSWH